MKFLKNWTIDLATIPAYVEFNQDFIEHVDYALANIILNSNDERLSPESVDEFRKLVNCINPLTNELKVKYSPRKGIGRRYADCPTPTYPDGKTNPSFGKYYAGLIAMPRIIKNTLFKHQGASDYDQVKGHPTILFEIAKRNGRILAAYEDYLKPNRFDAIVTELSNFYSGDTESPLTKKDIKWLFNKTIYGGGFNEWIKDIKSGKKKNQDGRIVEVRAAREVKNETTLHPLYQAFYNDTQSVISLVYESNQALVEVVCSEIPNTDENQWKRKNRAMSYFCGIIENEITFQAYKFACSKGVCVKRCISWGYDGFTIQKEIPANLLVELNAHVCSKTGLSGVKFIKKEFDDAEILNECIQTRVSFVPAAPVLNEVDTAIIDSLTSTQLVAINASIDNINDFGLATAFNALYGSDYVCTNNNRKDFYCFNKITNLWGSKCGDSPIRNQISTEFKSIYECMQNQMMIDSPEESKMRIKNAGLIMQRCGQSGDKDHIVKELSDLIKDTDFPDDMNKSLYMIPTNDGCVLDMRTLTSVPRTIEHKFSFEINAKYIPYDATIPAFGVVDKYFNDLFCNDIDTKNCFINVLKSVLTGRALRYIYFCIGVGSNGKSLFFKILGKIFGKFVDTIASSVIIEQSGTKSALNTEIEKLDQCRIALVSELSGITKFNEATIKQITGGDAFNLRTLHTKDKTMQPTTNIFAPLNVGNMPSFDGDSRAFLNRFITFRFNGIFEINTAFEAEMLELSDYIFSYIMHFGIICDKFELSAEMRAERDKHIEDNKDTSIEEFLAETLEDCVNDKATNKLIVVNDLRIQFDSYCSQNKLKNAYNKRKFNEKLKALGLDIKDSNSKVMLYGKRFKDPEDSDGDM